MTELRRLGTGYFTLRQIKAATDDFDHRNKIGEGGFGPVFKVNYGLMVHLSLTIEQMPFQAFNNQFSYFRSMSLQPSCIFGILPITFWFFKGTLPDGKVIAVKQLSSTSKQGNREFVNEIGMISALQHPNLVKLYGCCIEGKELLLVYEYMENNSLARALFGKCFFVPYVKLLLCPLKVCFSTNSLIAYILTL